MGEADCETESTFKRKEGRSQEKNDVLEKWRRKHVEENKKEIVLKNKKDMDRKNRIKKKKKSFGGE